MHDSARPGSRRGERTRAPAGSPVRPAGGEFPALSRSAELAAELLDVTNESELEGFLGGLVAETVGSRRPDSRRHGRALAAVLRKTAERTLPTLTTALGDETGPRRAAAA